MKNLAECHLVKKPTPPPPSLAVSRDGIRERPTPNPSPNPRHPAPVYSNHVFHAPPFTNCVACSDNVVREYRDAGKAFLLDVFNSDKGDVLEVTSGIHDLLRGLSSARRQNNDGILGDDDDVINDDDEDAFGACSEEEDF